MKPHAWPTEAFRRPGDGDIFRVGVTARAKAAADIGTDDADLLFLDFQRAGDHVPVTMDALIAGSNGKTVRRRIVFADAGPWFHLTAGDSWYIE